MFPGHPRELDEGASFYSSRKTWVSIAAFDSTIVRQVAINFRTIVLNLFTRCPFARGLGWVDLNFKCSIVGPILNGLTGI